MVPKRRPGWRRSKARNVGGRRSGTTRQDESSAPPRPSRSYDCTGAAPRAQQPLPVGVNKSSKLEEAVQHRWCGIEGEVPVAVGLPARPTPTANSRCAVITPQDQPTSSAPPEPLEEPRQQRLTITDGLGRVRRTRALFLTVSASSRPGTARPRVAATGTGFRCEVSGSERSNGPSLSDWALPCGME